MESKLKLPLSGVLYNKNGGYISIHRYTAISSFERYFFFRWGGGGGGAGGNVDCEPRFIVCYHHLV